MAPPDEEQRSGFADAAGRAAFFPARTAARVWRDQFEAAVDEVLSAPEISRVIDRALAGSLPEDMARSVVRHRVLERVVVELASSGELERLLNAALASPRSIELTGRVLASDETQRACDRLPRAPRFERRSRGRRRGLRRRSWAASGQAPCGSTVEPSISSSAANAPAARSSPAS